MNFRAGIPGFEPQLLSSIHSPFQLTQLSPGMAGLRARREASSWGPQNTKGSHNVQLARKSEASRLPSSSCDPAIEPNAQEDLLKTRRRLELFLEIHGSETYLRWGCQKAAEGLICLEVLPHPELKCFKHLTSLHHLALYQENWEQTDSETTVTQASGYKLKSALDYHTGARISSLVGQTPEHTKPLLFPRGSGFVFCVE